MPVVLRASNRLLFENTANPANLVLFLSIKFEISNREIRGYVVFVMDINSIDELRLLIGGYIKSVGGD